MAKVGQLTLPRTGYWAQGNEFSFHMLLAGNFLLNRSMQANEFPLFPWVEQPCNVRHAVDQVRCVRIPDVCPATVASELSAGEGGEGLRRAACGVRAEADPGVSTQRGASS